MRYTHFPSPYLSYRISKTLSSKKTPWEYDIIRRTGLSVDSKAFFRTVGICPGFCGKLKVATVLKICSAQRRKGGNIMDFSGLPIGFSMSLAENEVALNVFSALPEIERQKVIAMARHAQTVEEMHSLVHCLATKGNFL